MTNYLLTKGYKYYVRLSGNGQPILGSMVARKVPPRRSNGTWVDITSCLTGCCGVTLTATDTSLTITSQTGSIIDLAGVVSSSSDTLTVSYIDTDAGALIIDTDGTFTVTSTLQSEVVVVVTDTHGNSVTITVVFNVVVE